MDSRQKIEILDNLEIELLLDGYQQLSFDLEELEDLHPDLRWKETALCLQEADLPDKYAAFIETDPDWQAAAAALTLSR